MGRCLPLLWNGMNRYVLWDVESGRSTLRSRPARGVKTRGSVRKTLCGRLAFYFDPEIAKLVLQWRGVKIVLDGTFNVNLTKSSAFTVLEISTSDEEIRVRDLNDWPLRDPQTVGFLEFINEVLTNASEFENRQRVWGD